ncbi:alpha/beta hydrolase [Shimia sp. MMG029]|uniref:alpha/beta hydrolase n=1 Tax=Shimia sp. MMG029 TaxID=3021978 RepID=UPI0022FEBB18|nr:alpha/beta hydrolase [Shimia sp. MMG029]MDA5556111.1 alpha/beta hydrolase [Shimia sp. MMG029]
MRRFGRILGRVLLCLILIGAALYFLGPTEQISLTPQITDADVGRDVDAHFAASEAQFDDLTPGVQKRVVWHGDAGAPTALSILYVHGFSATSEEIRPVPDQVAAALGANLVYTRLAGHGRDGAALDAATVQDWANDLAEALIVARRVGEEVVVISTSTGGTLVAGMADQSDVMAQVKAMIFVAPNFGINSPVAGLLTLPAARHWVSLLAGKERSFAPANEAQATYWTTHYPTTAVLQMAALVKEVVGKDYSGVITPALFWFSDDDTVVDPSKTRAIAARWGGDVVLAAQSRGADADPDAHVIAGDIMSPGETARTVEAFVNFINDL